MNFLDLFSGIGGFRLGMERAGHKCIGYAECDPYCSTCEKITKHDVSEESNFTICTICGKKCRQHARFSYQAMHDTKGEWTAYDLTIVTNDDIRQLRDRGRIDVICGGFPCQAFSIAGQRKGFEDTRGTLFFEIARFASIIRPRYLFLENVKGLLNHDSGNTFETILRTLDELGYDVEWDLLNSKDFGVPQNRERVFIIGHLREKSTRKVFPVRGYSESVEINIIGTTKSDTAKGINSSSWVHDTSGIVGALSARDYKQPKQIIHAVLTPDRVEKRQNGRRFKEDGEPMFTLTSQDRHGVAIQQRARGNNKGGLHELAPTLTSNSYQENNHLNDGLRIRKLTPKECWRLQGFPDELFDCAAAVNSDSQLYKQAGNSVTVNVIYDIAKKLRK